MDIECRQPIPTIKSAACEFVPSFPHHRNALIIVGTSIRRTEQSNFKVSYVNARSERNKADDLAECINEENIDNCTVTETWLNSKF